METSNQVTIKVQHKEDLRRFSFPKNAPFQELEKILRNIFSFPPNYPLVVQYQDDESDWVSCSSDVELLTAFGFVSSNSILRLLIPSRLEPEVPASVEKMVNEEPCHVLDEQKACNSPSPPAPVPFPVGDSIPPWRGWAAWKAEKEQQKKAWKDEKQQGKRRCEWTDEERAAWLEKRAAWKAKWKGEKDQLKVAKKEWKCDRKHWKAEHKQWRCRGGMMNPTADDPTCQRPCKAKWRGRFVKHVTVPDGTSYPPGAAFIKTWRFRNESKESWPLGSKILFVGKNSDQMGGPDELEVGKPVGPGAEVDVSVPMVTPSQPGTYVGFWRLAEPDSKRFGQRVRVQIQVLGDSSSSSSSSCDAEPTTPAPISVKTETMGLPAPFASVLEGQEMGRLMGQLREMGFGNEQLNLKLAQKHNGDLSKIVKKLVRREKREMALGNH